MMKVKKIKALVMIIAIVFAITACDLATSDTETSDTETSEVTQTTIEAETILDDNAENISVVNNIEGSLIDSDKMFTDRDLEQDIDLTDSISITLISDEEVLIDSQGIYVLSGHVSEVTIVIEADDEDKVQLILDDVSIINENDPAIYVKSADKVFVTTTDTKNTIEVSGLYQADGDTNLDAAIFSKTNIVLNGLGSLEIISEKGNGITSKDDLKITGGTYLITSLDDALEANDSIRIYDGQITIVTDKDGLHSENEDDSDLGYIYIQGGILNITATDDAIRATSLVQIDGGDITIPTCSEGIEGTYIQINGGNIDIYANDDGINATAKSDYDVVIEVNGGIINVVMASGDTDAFDANGVIYVNDGEIDVQGMSSFDADVSTSLNGGSVTVNGEVITEITQSNQGKGGSRLNP